jgi:hypothetical protein
MVAVELLFGAIGAAASLGAGLIKTFGNRKPESSDPITVTVHQGDGRIEKQGTIRSDKVSEVLAMVDERKTPPPAQTAAR